MGTSKEVRKVGYPATGFDKKAVSNSVVALTAAKIANAKGVFVTVETSSIRWRIDGSDPTSTNGHLATSGSAIEIYDPTQTNLNNFKMIREATDATVQITYF